MKKRFTDIEKWAKIVWFRNLSPADKLFWYYIHEMCDDVGVWEIDLEQAEFHIKASYNLNQIKDVFKDHIYEFDNGRKWWLKGFVKFQYKELHEYTDEEIEKNPNLKHSPRPKYVEMLKDHGLWDLYMNANKLHSTPTSEGLKWDKEEEKEEYKEKEEKESKEIKKEDSFEEQDKILDGFRKDRSTVNIEIPRINNVFKGDIQ